MKRALLIVCGLALVACGPRIKPEGPDEEPTDSLTGEPSTRPPKPAAPPPQEVLIGEMCPTAAAGRAGVMPLFARRLGWNDDRDELSELLERNMARQFSVLGWDGRRVGVFTAVGAATSEENRVFAAGSYAGGSACEVRGKGGAEPTAVPACEKTLYACGVAIAVLRPSGGQGRQPFEEDPDPVRFKSGGACASGGKLLIDVDADGRVEAFPAARFLDPFRAPAEEVTAVAGGGAKCDPSFAIHAALPAGDPRDWRGLDIVGVLDLDADGRFEIIAIYNYQGRRTWAVYSARSTAGRLDLVAEGVPWPRPD